MERSLGYRWAALLLIAGVSLARLVYLGCFCDLELAPDEAYYWDWSRQLDWSYHSKGPLVAWLIRLSCGCLGDTMFAVRLPAVVCGAVLALGLWTLTRRVHAADWRAFWVVALSQTMPVVAASASLMTIDAPFLSAWIWALVFVHAAIFRGSRRAWGAAGVCLCLGILAKHTMILWLPSLALFLWTTPALRPLLWRPGFWVMTGLGTLGGAPILWWNVRNGWVTLWHARSHAGLEEYVGIRWLGPLNYVGAQAAVLLGSWFALWVFAMWRHRPTVETNMQSRWLWWMSAPTFLFFCAFAFSNGGGEANWPLAAYLSGIVLVAGIPIAYPQAFRYGAWATAAVGFLVMVVMHQPATVRPILLRIAGPATPKEPVPLRRIDPTIRLYGWRALAMEVDRAVAELRTRGIEPVIAGERWTLAAELAFHCENQPYIYCIGNALGDRDSQYDVWRPNPVLDAHDFRHQTFVIAGLELERLSAFFDSLEPIRIVEYRENGQPLAVWNVAIATGFRAGGNKAGKTK